MIVDLRSDTVTRPSKEMRQVMAEAEVGDDVLGDDPNVNALQEKAAKLLGKEDAVFMPSGTMANQAAIRAHTEPGDEIMLHEHGHVFMYETGALGGISGVQTALLPGDRGIISAKSIQQAMRPVEFHYPPSKLVVIENTHNQGGGSVYPMDRVKDISETAHGLGLKVHMDGARLWNACAASGYQPADYAKHCDTVSVCLSKGLGAPVGSLVVGTKDFIWRVKRFRKMLGGAMRQSGILAAAGIYALDHNRERVKEDHENAKHLATELSKMPNLMIQPDDIETNIVHFGIEGKDSSWIEIELKKQDIWLYTSKPGHVRAVTHMDVSREGIDKAIGVIRELAK